jgi:hypothetical protein
MSPGPGPLRPPFPILVFVAAWLAGCVDLARPGAESAMNADAPVQQPALDGPPSDRGAEPQPPDNRAVDDGAPTPPEDAAPDPVIDAGAIEGPGTPATTDAAEAGAPVVVDAPVDTPSPIETAPPVDLPPPPVDTRPAGLGIGIACTSNDACINGRCVDGVCCATSCADACQACNLAGHLGTCTAEPANTVCGPATCSGGVAQAESRCNGSAQCVPATASTTTCAPYACAQSTCGSACTGNADCAAPYTCSNNACTSPGLLLHWTFDEDSGNTVQDSSGNGRTGTGVGNGSARPQPSTSVAPLKFPNPRSRDFVGSSDEGIVATPIPAQFKTGANPEMTMSAWFRATSVDIEGSDVVALGTDFGLRIKSDEVEFIKRKSTSSGQVFGVASGNASVLDGAWHHIAGTNGATGQRVYLDGVDLGSASNNLAPIYNGPDEIGAGHQPGSDAHECTGQVDDVRIYGRVLSFPEIVNLARGNR